MALFLSSGFLLFFTAPDDGLYYLLHRKRLGQMGVHAGLLTDLRIFIKGIGCHGYDGDSFRVRPFCAADGSGCCETVHLRHHHLNASVHLVNQPFYNGHAQTGSLLDASCVGMLLCERLIDMLQKLFAHANAGIRNNPPVGHGTARCPQIVKT